MSLVVSNPVDQGGGMAYGDVQTAALAQSYWAQATSRGLTGDEVNFRNGVASMGLDPNTVLPPAGVASGALPSVDLSGTLGTLGGFLGGLGGLLGGLTGPSGVPGTSGPTTGLPPGVIPMGATPPRLPAPVGVGPGGGAPPALPAGAKPPTSAGGYNTAGILTPIEWLAGGTVGALVTDALGSIVGAWVLDKLGHWIFKKKRKKKHMNVLNPRALGRANRRVIGFAHRSRRVLKEFGFIVHHARRLPAHAKGGHFGHKKK